MEATIRSEPGFAVRSGPSGRMGPGKAVALALLILATGTALVAILSLIGIAWLVARHPYGAAVVGATSFAYARGGPMALVIIASLTTIGAAGWRAAHRPSFDRLVLHRWRRAYVYGRRWRRVMAACDLDRISRGRRRVPRLGQLRSTPWSETVSVRPLMGQTAATFAARARELALAFGAQDCSVRSDATGTVQLTFRRTDPLAAIVIPHPIAERPDLDALPIGAREDGGDWTVSLMQGHLLITGPRGSGKGSVVWSLVRALAVPVRDGSIVLWGIDGTGGLGLAVGAPLFSRLALADVGEGAAILDAAAATVRRRARLGRHQPSPAEPLIVLVLDEVARWARALDDQARRRLSRTMELVLGHGCAAGVVIVAAGRTARPAADPWFAHRVRLWLSEPDGRALRPGTGYYPSGQRDIAPRQQAGVGFAVSERDAPVRVRASWISDDEVAAVAADFGPLRPPASRAPAP
jgi:S-DNA-T family DNA segregation ATPase FtsK/SpoIIIE